MEREDLESHLLGSFEVHYLNDMAKTLEISPRSSNIFTLRCCSNIESGWGMTRTRRQRRRWCHYLCAVLFALRLLLQTAFSSPLRYLWRSLRKIWFLTASMNQNSFSTVFWYHYSFDFDRSNFLAPLSFHLYCSRLLNINFFTDINSKLFISSSSFLNIDNGRKFYATLWYIAEAKIHVWKKKKKYYFKT